MSDSTKDQTMLQRRKPLRRTTKPKKKSSGVLSKLISLADQLFSKFIKKKYADKDGNVRCYTCPAILPIEKIQCGHYVKRGNYIVRWSDKNARPQCPYCNEGLDGNKEVFTKRLEQEEPGVTEKLEQMGRKPFKLERDFVEDIINKYSNG